MIGSKPRNRRRLVWFAAALAVAGAPSPLWAAKREAAVVKLHVDGAGLVRDRELRVALQRLLDTEIKESINANAIEDAAVILSSSLGEEGFQNPRIEIQVTLVDGEKKELV